LPSVLDEWPDLVDELAAAPEVIRFEVMLQFRISLPLFFP
jgi:hypothetical protein